MDIEVQEQRAPRRVCHGEAELLGRLTLRRHVGRLAGVDVTAGLHPDAQALVEMQDSAAAPDHDARGGDVRRIGVFVARRGQATELGQEAGPGRLFTR